MDRASYKLTVAEIVRRHGIKIWAGLAVYGNGAIMTTALLSPDFQALLHHFWEHAGNKTSMTLLAGSLAVMVFSLVAYYANHDEPPQATFEEIAMGKGKFVCTKQDFDALFQHLRQHSGQSEEDLEELRLFLQQHVDIQDKAPEKLVEHTSWREQLNPTADPIRFSANTLLPIATFYALRGLERFAEVKNVMTDIWDPLLSSSMGGLSLAGLAIQKAPAGWVGGEEWRKKLSGWAFLLSSVAPIVEGVRHLAEAPVTGVLFISAGLSFIIANTVYLHSRITRNIPSRLLDTPEKLRQTVVEGAAYGQRIGALRTALSMQTLGLH